MSENQAGQVLTSENAAEFYAQKLGIAPAQEPTEAVEQTEPVVEEADGSEPEAKEEATPQDEPKKQNPKLEKRFSDITKQREEARREAESERQRRVELEQRLAALEQQNKPQQVVQDQEPQPSQFQDAFEYAKALAEYTADKRIEEMKAQEANAKAEAERQQVIQAWATKVEAAKADLPDFDAMVASSDVVVNDAIRDAILESDVGPKILYHLAEDADYARKVAGMPIRAALKEIGKLEARFEAKAEEKPVVRSKAPAPVTPIRAAAGIAETKLDSNGQWFGSYSEWKAARKAGRVR
jgi:chromosome segregation ATPase